MNAPFAQAQPASEARATARLDAAIDSALEERRIVGAVVLVSRDGRVVYRRAAGFSDREAGRTARVDDIFRLASVTKPIVAATALALVERGRFALETPVDSILPDFRPRLADGRAPRITIRHLLTHTSGLGYRFAQADDGPYAQAGVSDGLDQPGMSLAENLRRIASAPLATEPGTHWAYSVAIDVLGAVIEKACDAPLGDVVAELVTRPLDMRDTGFTVADRSRLAAAYADGVPEPVRMGEHHIVPFQGMNISFAPDRIFDPASFPSGGGGMAGTAGDVLAFLEAIRTGGGPILRPATVEAAMHNQIGDLPILVPGRGWGLLASVLKDPVAADTPQSPGTLQWGGVYGHSWFIDPTERLTVVALTNTAIEGMAGLFPIAIRDALYDRAPGAGHSRD